MKYLPIILLYLFANHLKANDQESVLAEKFIEIIEPMGFLGAKYIPYNQTEIPIELKEIPDSELIEMMAAYIHTRKWNSPFSEAAIRELFNVYPGLIRDDTKFRELLSSETDARRFHLLGANFLGRVSDDENTNYIVEMAHMLLRDDPVCELRGEASRDIRFRDVSRITYLVIVQYLQKLDASFEEPPQNLPHAERKIRLAKWLKENWPGCENLQIEEQKTEQSHRESPGNQQERAQRRTNTQDEVHELDSPQSSSRWIWVAGGIMLLVVFYGFIRIRKC